MFIKFEERRDVIPGPTYVPPTFGASAPKFNINEVRKREIGQGLVPIGPGPGRHDTRPVTGAAAPKYTVKARQFPDNLGGPDGPGAGKYIPDYSRILPADLKGRAILERFKQRSVDPGPGYSDLGGTNTGLRWTMRQRPHVMLLKGSR
jgi:hypothetical protein